MNIRPLSAVPSPISRIFAFFCTAVMLVTAGAASAQDIVRVEEDWELVLGAPDGNSCGPQITTTMSPTSNLDGTFFTMEINHKSAPYWSPGGISIHHWCCDWRMGSFDRNDRSVMTTTNETVTWTQALYVDSPGDDDEDDGGLTFKIFGGVSTTWGPFGYSNYVKLSQSWTPNHINGYTPAVSVGSSGVPYAGNRVQSLKIKCIRLFLSDGEVLEDNTVRVVHLLVE